MSEYKKYPLVSIILCTYNGEKYLAKQLDSIFSQTYPNIELILVDDKSKDNTFEILQKYAQKTENSNNIKIQIYQNEINLGYIKNFEKGISFAKGDYIAISDQDDIWHHEKIMDCVENIEEYALIYHDSEFIDEQDNLLNNKISQIIKMYEGNDCRALLLDNCVSGHSMLFKKEIIPFIFPFSTLTHYDWWIAFVACAYKGIKYLDKPLVQYRQHNNNVTDMLGRNENTQQSETPYLQKQKKIAYKRLQLENDLNRLTQFIKANFSNKKHEKYVNSFLKSLKLKENYVFVPSLCWIWLQGVNIVFETRYKKRKSKINHIIITSLFRIYNNTPDDPLWREKYHVKF